MNKKVTGILGIIVGLAIIMFSFVVFNFDANISHTSMSNINTIQNDLPVPEKEEDERYGGDAYTGMQQAAAQAANNMIPVYEAINHANAQSHANATTINANLKNMVDSEASNTAALISAGKTFFGFMLLSVGLLTILKYFTLLMGEKASKVAPAAPAAAKPVAVPVMPVAAPEKPAAAPAPRKVDQNNADPSENNWNCPKCGTKNLNSRTTCWRCDYEH